ncbi:MAG: Ig-like domain-containing protein [Roseburia sp.]|nr:Ig-like domain-containing protein [Roseburia sp.]
MKAKTYKVISLIVALLVAVLMTVGYVFAWLIDRRQSELKISGTSAGAYFDSGDGSAETPFVIANPTHMHNLAVLQNMGRFVDRNGNPQKYYFTIKESVAAIDMSGRYIPPIGNDEYPFIGDFNGKGKTIANLQVTTNKEDLKDEYPRHADSDYEFSQAVGLFGMTGGDSNIHNVILENPSVTVSATDTRYSSTANAAVGLAVGYVAGKCSSVGVLAKGGGSELNVNVAGYSTFNSILGVLGEGVESSVTGGGFTEGGDIGYGAPTDLKDLYVNTLGNKDGGTIGKATALPFKPENHTLVAPSSSKLSMELSAGTKQVDASTTQTATSNNIGYYVGSDIKGYYKPAQVNYSKFYYPDTSTSSVELPQYDYEGNLVREEPSDDVKEYLEQNGSYLLRLSSTSQFNVQNEGNLTVIENGQVGNYKGKVLVPVRCIWVAPVMAGKLRFVFMNIESSGMGVRVMRLTRSKPGDYSSYFYGAEQIIECNNLMLSGKAYYFEIEIGQTEIDDGYEYAVTTGDNYKPYIAYIDIGANGGNVHNGEVDLEKSVSAVDFVYDGVEILQSETGNEGKEGIQLGDFIKTGAAELTRYEATKTSVYFSGITDILKVVYLRLHDRDDKKTVNLTNFTSDTIKNSEVKATLVNFVLPEGIKGGSGNGSGGASTGGGNTGGGSGEVVEVPATSIAITGGNTVALNALLELSVDFTPSDTTDRNITWEIVSGEEYVNFNSVTGELTGKADGKVVIKATTAGGISATLEITVGTGGEVSGGDTTDLLSGFTATKNNGDNFIDNTYLSANSSGKAEQVTLTAEAFGIKFSNVVRASSNRSAITIKAKGDCTLTIYYCVTNGTTIRSDNTVDITYPTGVTGTVTDSSGTDTANIHKLVVSLSSGQSLTLTPSGNRMTLLALFAE